MMIMIVMMMMIIIWVDFHVSNKSLLAKYYDISCFLVVVVEIRNNKTIAEIEWKHTHYIYIYIIFEYNWIFCFNRKISE